MLHSSPQLLLYGFNGEDITAELDIQNADYETKLNFSSGAPWAIITLIQFGVPALAAILVAWLRLKAGRSIRLQLKDGTEIEAKGMSPKELAEHLAVAMAAELHQDKDLPEP